MNNREIQKYTLEDVIEQRNKALEDVRKSGENIKRKMRLLFDPPKQQTGTFCRQHRPYHSNIRRSYARR